MTSRSTQDDWDSLPDDALVERFAGVTAWRANGKRAPHKPLLMVYALARVQRGQPRLVRFCEIEERVGERLRAFGPPHKTQPAYPFWRLKSDGLWIIPDRERRILQADVVARPGSSDARLSLLRRVDAHGGLPPTRDAGETPALQRASVCSASVWSANLWSAGFQPASGTSRLTGPRRPRGTRPQTRVLEGAVPCSTIPEA